MDTTVANTESAFAVYQKLQTVSVNSPVVKVNTITTKSKKLKQKPKKNKKINGANGSPDLSKIQTITHIEHAKVTKKKKGNSIKNDVKHVLVTSDSLSDVSAIKKDKKKVNVLSKIDALSTMSSLLKQGVVKLKKNKQKKSDNKAVEVVQKKAVKTPNSVKNAGKLNGTVKSSTVEEDEDVIDPVAEATEVFREIIHPIELQEFFKSHWEKKPLLVQRGQTENYHDWFSTQEFDFLLREHRVMFTEHLDVTSYRDGKRETHNPEGRALAASVWDYYNQGCSLRLLCPQAFHDRIYQKLSILHEFFGSFVGSNIYLTPPGTQGFAPHWDDIEAFILQLEGKKHWRVYKSRNAGETLPRFSSGNFSNRDSLGHPVIDVVLEAGDLLYIPRGCIHQANCLDTVHSLHITLSTYQQFAWVDFMEHLLKDSLAKAAAVDVEFRRGLPRGFLSYMGEAHANVDSKVRTSFSEHTRSLMTRLMGHMDLDLAADKVAVQQCQDALPPALDPSETDRSVFEGGERWSPSAERVVNVCELNPDTPVRLLRASSIRYSCHKLFYSLENTRIFRQVDPMYLEVDRSLEAGILHLIKAYPSFTKIEDLPLRSLDDQMNLAVALYDKGLLVSKTLMHDPDLSDSEMSEDGLDVSSSS